MSDPVEGKEDTEVVGDDAEILSLEVPKQKGGNSGADDNASDGDKGDDGTET